MFPASEVFCFCTCVCCQTFHVVQKLKNSVWLHRLVRSDPSVLPHIYFCYLTDVRNSLVIVAIFYFIHTSGQSVWPDLPEHTLLAGVHPSSYSLLSSGLARPDTLESFYPPSNKKPPNKTPTNFTNYLRGVGARKSRAEVELK